MMSHCVVFPGQGSQSMGMLAGLKPEYQSIYDEVVSIASTRLGMDVHQLITEGPETELNRTEITQPVLLAMNHIVWQCWLAEVGQDDLAALAGHSLGEFNALVAAGCLSFEDALDLVAYRGQLMQSAVPLGEGGMAAILGLPDDVVEAICREVAEDEVVAPANYNSPGQLVIAGQVAAVERAMLQAKAAGAKKVLMLPVSVPSHCALMGEAAKALGERLTAVTLQSPSIPIIHNVDAEQHPDVDGLRQAIVRQLAEPVQWTRLVKRITAMGVDRFYECGPGRVLCGLGRRIDKEQEWIGFEQEIRA